MPTLQQKRGQDDTQAELHLGMRLQLLDQHAHRQQQAKDIYGIEAGKTGGPEAPGGQCSALRAVGVVVREDESGEQEKKADRDVSAVNDGAERPKGTGIGKMEENQVERGKTTNTRESR
jgi:hypothetical protein